MVMTGNNEGKDNLVIPFKMLMFLLQEQ